MKSILLSINPEEVAKILNGEKTIAILKKAPKCELPIEVYIYCTKEGRPFVYGSPVSGYVEEKYIQTFGWNHEEADRMFGSLNGKVVASFTLNKVDWFCTRDFFGEYKEGVISISDSTDPAIVRKSCASQREIDEYTKGKPVYAWHIDDLQIFDEPKKLLIRAPRPWCYVKKKKWAN